jgi:predicted amidohydrolase YtcJ
MRRLAPDAPRLSWAIGAAEGLLTPVPGPESLPGGAYGASGREAKLFLDGGDRCALHLPARALGRLTAGALRASLTARNVGPLRDAMSRPARIHGRDLTVDYLRYTDRDLAALLARFVADGVRPRLHALGNLAARQAAAALREIGAPPGAAVIDHLVLLDPATTDLVAASGATATYQPGFLATFGPQIVGTGSHRYLAVLAGRALLDAGVPLTIGSDHPAGPLDPLANLRLAVGRALPDGTPLQPGQALTPSEAVRGYTTAAAAALGAPGAGGLAPGEAADLVVCDADPFDPAARITRVWVAGRPAWPR